MSWLLNPLQTIAALSPIVGMVWLVSGILTLHAALAAESLCTAASSWWRYWWSTPASSSSRSRASHGDHRSGPAPKRCGHRGHGTSAGAAPDVGHRHRRRGGERCPLLFWNHPTVTTAALVLGITSATLVVLRQPPHRHLRPRTAS
ncbi:hypothetical protein STENM327S_07732 [Streptomyces tendae]